MARECGGCTQCCRTMAIKELSKPANVWCSACDIGKGCTIYEGRPTSCREFECLWLSDEQIPEELRPDKSKVVLSLNEAGDAVIAYVDPKQEKSCYQGLMARLLKDISDHMPVILVIGDKRKLITTINPAEISLSCEEMDGTVNVYKPRV